MNEKQLKHLLSEMSLREKIGQMIQLTGVYFDEQAVLTGAVGEDLPPEWIIKYAGSVLGMIGADKIYEVQKKYVEEHPHHIPLLFMADIIHGCRTIFPIPLGQACSFHPELVRKAAMSAASEASSQGIKATFSPMIDVSRDPRWGRIMESFGEDPYLNGVMGRAMLEGYQKSEISKDGYEEKHFSREISDDGMAGCLKHFAGYGAVNAGREYNDVEISQRTFTEQYLKPFRMALKARPAMVMSAFNAIDRKPVSGNKELLKHVLREQEGFEGVIISDWGSIGQLEEQRVVSGQKEAAYAAAEAGVDIDMMSPAYMFWLEELVKNGDLPEALIDECVWRILEMKNRLGLFENPFSGIKQNIVISPDVKSTAFQLACESCVLLKNENILPLKHKEKVFWVGPYVKSQELLSRWAIFGKHSDVDTIQEALNKKEIQAECIQGCSILSDEECKIWQAKAPYVTEKDYNTENLSLDRIGADDTVVMVLGEHEAQSGEAASRAFLSLPKEQMELFERITERTSRIITVILTGRPLDLRRISEKSRAVLIVWRPGTLGAEAIVSLIYGMESPSGKLSVSIPWCVGQVPISYWDMTTGHLFSKSNPDDRFVSRYMDIPNTPLYPFGYGLTYTSFEISDFHVYAAENENVCVSCKVENTGAVPGAEVIQCYAETICAPVVRPAKELIRFKKVFLKPGEKIGVNFTVGCEKFSFYGKNMERINRGFQVRIIIGNSSSNEADSCVIQL